MLRCGNCDRELQPDARFCDGCGTPTAAAPPASPAPASPAKETAVRKTVTVLFCDLVGSTAFAETVDTESAREAMGRYHAMAQATIEANGGTVAKFIGDGVMALFGVPDVAEDDAERAVATGRDLQRGFDAIREHIANRYGVGVGLRVGINTGEVVIDDADADLVGDVLNTAARLEAECTPGEVLVGEDTWRLTRSTQAFEHLGEVTVKGKRDGLATYQLVGTNHADADHATRTELAIPFVGRDAELARLHDVLDDAVASGEARLATVIGSPGVGKTRLARELGRAVGDGAQFVELRCERAGTATFAPIAELLQVVAGFGDDDTPEEIIGSLHNLVDDSSDAARLVDLLGSFVGTAPVRSTEDAFFAVRRLVELLGQRRPLVLVIDDIQWAEPLFLDLLEHLARWAKGAPSLVLGLARPELRDLRPALSEVSRRVSCVISLEGLDAAATEQLAAELLGGAALPQELTQRLPSSTDGNPLFVRELVRMLVDDGVIEQRDGRWELAVDAEAIEVPPTIQSLLATRVERLPHAERRVMELASVIGPEFPLGALAALLADIERPDLEDALERLRRKEQVEPTGTYWGDEPIVRFHHVLIRDAAYRRLLKGARADLHLQVGTWLEESSAHLVGEFDVMIAHHFEQAYVYRRQLNDNDPSTVAAGRKAAALLHRAADAALQRDDLAAAGGYASRAIEVLTNDADDLPELLLLACEAFLSSGDVGSGRALVKQLGDHAVGDDRLEAWTTCFEAHLAVLTEPDGLRAACDQAADAAAQLQHLGDQAGVAKARIIRANALARLGQVGAAEGELDLALTAARAADDRRRITAVLSAAPVAALWGPSPVPRAGGRCLDVVRLSRITADSPEVEATSVRCQAVLEGLRGRFDTARSLIATARATTEEIGLRHGLLETEFFAGIIELLAGDPVAAEPHLRSAYGGLGQLGIGADAGQAAAYLARAMLLQGRLDEADELATDSDALAGQNPQTAIAARSAQAEILAVRGDTGDALVLAEEAVRLAAGTDIILDHANALATLARVRAADGDAEGADRAAAAAGELFEQKGATVLVDLARGDRRTSPNARSGPTDEVARSVEVSPEGVADQVPQPSTRTDDEPWNHADACSRRAAVPFRDRDVDGWAAFVDEAFTGHDHRRLLGHSMDSKEAMLELTREMFALTEGEFLVDRQPIAARGEQLVLVHHRFRLADDPTGPMIEFLEIVHYLPNGKQVHSSFYDVEDLHLALDELDEWYLDADHGEHVDPIVEGVLLGHRLASARLVDRIMALLHPSIEMVDHRNLGWGTVVGAESVRERFESTDGLPDSFRDFVARFIRYSSLVVVTESRIQMVSDEGASLLSRYILLTITDASTGLCTRMEQYELEDLPAALDRYDELVAAQLDQLVNDAVVAGGIANHRVRANAIDRLVEGLADDFIAEGIGPDAVTIHDLRSGRVEPTALVYGVEFRQVISIIGDRLTMLYIETEGGERRFSVEEIDEHGRLARIRHFPAGALADAVNHLEVRWRAIESPPASVIMMNEWAARQRAHDQDGIVRLSHHEFTLTDHRPLGLERETYDTQKLPEPALNDGLGTLLPVRIHATSLGTVVARIAMVAVSDSGDIWEALTSTAVFAHRDGLVTHIELFAEDDVDAALARAAELDPEGFGDSAASFAHHEPWNRADRLVRRAVDHHLNGRDDEWAEMFDDSYTGDDRRALMSHQYATNEDLAAMVSATVDVVGILDPQAETLAARGDHLVLHRSKYTRPEDPSGFMVEALEIGEWNDHDRCVGTVSFDPNDLRAAIEELDRRYLDTLEPIESDVRTAALRFEQALNDGDLDRMMATFHPDVVFSDHRSLGWGPDSRFNDVRERFRTLMHDDGSIFRYTTKVHRQSSGLECAVYRLIVHRPEGGELIDDQLIVTRLDAATGLGVRSDQFPDDRLDAAITCFDTARAEIDAAIPAANAAVLAGGTANARARTAPLDEFLAMFADDFVAELVDGTTVTFDDLRSGRVEPQAIGYGITDRRIVSAFGELLALVCVGPDNGVEHWSVEEVDSDGRVVRLRQFPVRQFAGAVDQMFDRLAAIDRVRPPMLAMIALSHAQLTGDRVKLESCVADEFEFVDRREMGFGRADKGQYIDLQLTGADGTDELGVLFGRCLLATTDEVAVMSFARYFITEDGGFWEVGGGISVNTALDGRLTRIEAFGDDALDEALARAAELDPTFQRRSGERGSG